MEEGGKSLFDKRKKNRSRHNESAGRKNKINKCSHFPFLRYDKATMRVINRLRPMKLSKVYQFRGR